MTISEVKKQARLSEWRANIESQQSSGLTVKEWCERHGNGEGKYYYWLKQVRAEVVRQMEATQTAKQRISLMRVEPNEMAVTVATTEAAIVNPYNSIVVRYGQAVAELPAGTTAKALAELFKALQML